jgi:polar amino acid transport system substrate-binding protein
MVLGLLALVACGSGQPGNASVPENCTPKHKNLHTISDGALTVAAFNTLPMFEYTPGQPIKGIDGQLVETLAQMECLELRVNVMQASSAIPAVQSNRADIAAGGWYATAERKEVVGLTQPYYSDAVVFVSHEGYDQVAQVKGKKVGTVQGYLWPETLKALYGEDNVKIYQTPDAQFNDLAAGRIDAVVEGVAVGTQAVAARPNDGLQVKKVAPDPSFPETITPSVIALPFTPGNDSLGQALSEDIDELLSTGQIDTYLSNAGVDPKNAELVP